MSLKEPVNRFQFSCKRLRLDDGLCVLAALNIALVGVLVSGADGDDPLGPGIVSLRLR
jgi:hypothetical protein